MLSTRKILLISSTFAILILTHISITSKFPQILRDSGIPEKECERMKNILIFYSSSVSIGYYAAKQFLPIPTRKTVILGLTTIVVCTQLLMGAVQLKRGFPGFEINLRLSYCLKMIVFVNTAAFTLGPQILHGMYVDAIAPQWSKRPNAYFMSNMGCALIRFFTALPMIVVCVLFSSPTDYIPFFTAFLPLLSINVMAHALEQPPKVTIQEDQDNNHSNHHHQPVNDIDDTHSLY